MIDLIRSTLRIIIVYFITRKDSRSSFNRRKTRQNFQSIIVWNILLTESQSHWNFKVNKSIEIFSWITLDGRKWNHEIEIMGGFNGFMKSISSKLIADYCKTRRILMSRFLYIPVNLVNDRICKICVECGST